MVLSLEQYSIAFSLDYWWFSGELRHKHSIKDELLLLSQNLPWSKIIYFPAGFQLHLLIISYLLLKFWVVFLFHSIIFVFCYCFCFSFLGQGSTTKATHSFQLTGLKGSRKLSVSLAIKVSCVLVFRATCMLFSNMLFWSVGYFTTEIKEWKPLFRIQFTWIYKQCIVIMADYFKWNNRARFHSVYVQYHIKWVKAVVWNWWRRSNNGSRYTDIINSWNYIAFIQLIHLIEGNEELVLMVFLRWLAKSSQKWS